MSAVRLALLDNYDSFTYNLVHLARVQGAQVAVFRNDAVGAEELAGYDGLVLSPGPGDPDDAGVCLEAVVALSGRLPILGVCLGHQVIGQAFGGKVVRVEPVHGSAAWVQHDYSALYSGLPKPFAAGRYHSLVVEASSLPEELVMSAWTPDGLVMGLRHRSQPTYGVQFHPESVLTAEGGILIGNFLRRCAQTRPVTTV